MEAYNGELGVGKRGPSVLGLFQIYLGNVWLSLLYAVKMSLFGSFPMFLFKW